jgi:phosphatidylethanolamine-binding protein (PEBP) family uncharacterized protein
MPQWFEHAAEDDPSSPLPAVSFRLTSPAVHDLGNLPERHGGLADGVSPPLAWSEPPLAACELAVLLEERLGIQWLDDAFSFARGTEPVVLWLGWGLAPHGGRLDEGAEPPVRGTNDLGRVGYSGPEWVDGEHVGRALRFSVLALDAPVGLEEGAGREEFDAATAGHVLAAATLVARYKPERGLRALLRRRS